MASSQPVLKKPRPVPGIRRGSDHSFASDIPLHPSSSSSPAPWDGAAPDGGDPNASPRFSPLPLRNAAGQVVAYGLENGERVQHFQPVCVEAGWTRGKSILTATLCLFLLIFTVHNTSRNSPDGWYSSTYTTLAQARASGCARSTGAAASVAAYADALREDRGPAYWTGRIRRFIDEEDDEKRSVAEYVLAVGVVQNCTKPCNVLVFGADWNAALFLEANAAGTTLFLEDDSKWLQTVRRKVPCARAYSVHYGTRLRDWPAYMEPANVGSLAMTLPLEVWQTPWDVVVIQGPAGDTTRLGAWDNPGRMQSIYTAATLARQYFRHVPPRNERAQVLLFDGDRMVEKKFSSLFLGEDNVVRRQDGLYLFSLAPGFSADMDE